MIIDIGDRITLNDNRKYLVSSKVVYDNSLYYLLTDLENISEYKICLLTSKNTLIRINDEDVINKLVPYLVCESLNNIQNR